MAANLKKKYDFFFFNINNLQCAALSSTIQDAMPSEYGEKWETEKS